LDDVLGRSDDSDVHAEPDAPSEASAVVEPGPVTEVTRPEAPTAGDEQIADVSDIDVMLSMLAAEHRRSEPASELAERFGDRSTRVAVMVGGTLVVGAVLFAILTALGALL
jgi:hypothetical protein